MARGLIFIALMSLPAAVYVVEAVVVRPDPPAIVVVGAPVDDLMADTAAATFALMQVTDDQSIQQIPLESEFPESPAERQRDNRPPLVVSAPPFRVPTTYSVAYTIGWEVLADILADSVNTAPVTSLLPTTSIGFPATDQQARRGAFEFTRADAAPEPDRFYDLESLDEPPQLIGAAGARYPAALASQGVGGFVDVRFAIEPSGQTDSIQVLYSTDRRFDSAAREAIQRSRYRPGRIAGVAVRTMVEQRFTFGSASRDIAQESVLQTATLADSIPVDQSRLYDPNDVDVLPVPITPATPRYPQALYDQGVNGYADVEFVIGLSGMAERGSITITSASDWRFEQPAMEAIRRSVYRPGLIRSIPIRMRATQRVTFSPR